MLYGARMDNVLVAVSVVAPPLLIALFHRTRFWWLAGVLILAGALYLFSLVGPVDSDESDAGWGGIANFFLIVGGLLSAVYGFSALVFASWLHRRHLERVKNLPPAATVVAGVTGR